jgi:aspartate racemase
LHIAEVVVVVAAERGFCRVGLTGTRWLVNSDVYPTKLTAHGIVCIGPTAGERDETSRVIMEELVYGGFAPTGVVYFQQVIERMKRDGCEAVSSAAPRFR